MARNVQVGINMPAKLTIQLALVAYSFINVHFSSKCAIQDDSYKLRVHLIVLGIMPT